jgi:hypothetical protein
MHGTCIESVDAQQARLYNNYKNTRQKVLKANESVWFNKIFKTKQLTPKHFSVKIVGNNSDTY